LSIYIWATTIYDNSEFKRRAKDVRIIRRKNAERIAGVDRAHKYAEVELETNLRPATQLRVGRTFGIKGKIMEDIEIIKNVSECIDELVVNEKSIILNDICERTIAHKLAEYLQKRFPNYNVDCEYNRNSEEGNARPKYVDIIKEGYDKAFKRAKMNESDLKIFVNQVTSFPDIIIHQRLTNERNLLIVELKKSNNNSDWEIDKKKLEAFTREKDTEGYGYQLGLHLIIFIDKEWKNPELIWYKNGEEVEKKVRNIEDNIGIMNELGIEIVNDNEN